MHQDGGRHPDTPDPATDAEFPHGQPVPSHFWPVAVPVESPGEWVPIATPETDPTARRHDAQATFWNVVLGIDLGLLALLLLATLALVALSFVRSDPAFLKQATNGPVPLATALLIQAIFTLVTMALIPVLWAWRTRIGGWAGAKQYLGLHHAGRGIAMGVLWGFGLLALLVVAGLVMQLLGYTPDNASTEAVLKAAPLPLGLFLALSAGVGEEIFFRGLAQKRLGVIGQAILFGLFHASYGTLLQVIAPLILGLIFGLMVRRGKSLWVPIAAHVTFDAVQFTLASFAPTAN